MEMAKVPLPYIPLDRLALVALTQERIREQGKPVLAIRANFPQTTNMIRRRRRLRILVRWVDMLIFMALFAVMISALLRWPDKVLADIALLTAFLVTWMWWQNR
jgi:hypothetical protein